MPDYATTITLPDYKLGDYWPPSEAGDAKIMVGPLTFGPLPSGPFVPLSNAITRVVWTFRNGSRSYYIDSNGLRDAPCYITGFDTFEIRTIQKFLPDCPKGEWSFDCAIYTAANISPLTIYKGVITPFSDV